MFEVTLRLSLENVCMYKQKLQAKFLSMSVMNLFVFVRFVLC